MKSGAAAGESPPLEHYIAGSSYTEQRIGKCQISFIVPVLVKQKTVPDASAAASSYHTI
jgi:hypothetical protein